jgi:hypothetical protein
LDQQAGSTRPKDKGRKSVNSYARCLKVLDTRRTIAIVIAAVLSAIALRYHLKAEAGKKREVAYQAALRAYSFDLKPGLTRKEVEDYLRARNAKFSQMCCLGKQYKDYADLVKIGEEDAPWFCSEAYVYVAFEFAAIESHDLLSASPFARDSDVLRRIEIFRPLTGCL